MSEMEERRNIPSVALVPMQHMTAGAMPNVSTVIENNRVRLIAHDVAGRTLTMYLEHSDAANLLHDLSHAVNVLEQRLEVKQRQVVNKMGEI